ncbi:MAG: sensor histidine kinase [Acidimicrobiia bacterium]|nr:sensor histidine kinase [Acidimicrobiia bacterium]
MVTGDASERADFAGQPARPRQGPFTLWPHTADTSLAVLVFVLEVIGALIRQANESGEFSISMLGDAPPGMYLLLGASSVALLWRRSHPLLVLTATLTASIVWDVMGLAGGPSLAIFVSLYGIGRYITDNRASLIAVAAAMILSVADDLIEGEPISVFGVSLSVVILGWYIGRRVRGRREYLRLLEERAASMERERHAAAQRAVDEERARIARELHDVVAHRVSMITVQAGAAQTVATSDPERAIRAMKDIEEAGREALGELRQVLGVLRSDQQGENLVPVHGLAEISDLVAEMRATGLDVSLSSDGVPDVLPAKVGLASYRIVQEALTNVLKHAGPTPEAEVRLSTRDHMLTIEVTDRGSKASTLPGSGQGLVGMRERAALLGGTFEAGPRVGGGFRIMARLPIELEQE